MKNIKIGIIGYLIYCLALGPSLADTASLLPNAVQQFFDNNGNPLTSGKVTTYAAGTSTLKTTWKDSAETLPNTNPITLDGGGKAIIYGSGNYRQVVKDRNGNLIWDAVTAPGGGGSSPTSVGDGNLVGTILPWSGLVAPAQYVFAYGQELSRITYATYYTAITQQLNVICSSASNTLTGISDTSQVKIGSALELALCVPAGTTVTAKTNATITLSNPSSVSINAVATFFPWGNGNGTTTFNVPDLRGYIPIGRDNMGGSSANRITTANCGSGITPDALGANCNANVGGGHTLLQAELPNTNFPVTDPGHVHDIKGSTNAGGATQVSINAIINDRTVAGGGAGAIQSAVTGISVNSGGSGTAFSVTPPSVTLNYIAKVLPDTSTSIATGVFSIGGMSGVILCGTGILCTGNIISFSSSTFAGGTTNNIQFNGGTGTLAGSSNFNFISPDNLTLGAVGITGKFDILGSTSGSVRQVAQAVAGSPTITWGTSSGTPAVTASGALSINSTTGNVTCISCATIPAGGALSATTPIDLTAGVFSVPANAIANSKLVQSAAVTLKGNPTNALANVQDFTLAGLTQIISPDTINDFLLIWDHTANTFKKITAGSIATSLTSGVSSLNGLTGALNINNGPGIQSIAAVGATISISADVATAANFEAGTANKLLDAAVVFTSETTTAFGTTTALDANTFINTKVTLTGNITTLNCSNFKSGQAGTISFIQDSSGSRTAAFNSGTCGTLFKYVNASTPVLTISASAIDILSYTCRSSTYCAAALNKGFNP